MANFNLKPSFSTMRATRRLLIRAPVQGWESRVINEFNACKFVKQTLGATLSRCSPGEVDISLCKGSVGAFDQQNGYFHAGVTTTLADTAAGFAAFSLFEKGHSILTTELKINLLNAAKGDLLVAKGRVIKSGKTLSVVKCDVYCYKDENSGTTGSVAYPNNAVHVAFMSATMMNIAPLPAPVSS
jgi:uncharacterized protein (TIGR00369 family)